VIPDFNLLFFPLGVMWLKYFSQALTQEPLLLMTTSANSKANPRGLGAGPTPPPLPLLNENHFFTIIFNFYLVNYYTPAIQRSQQASGSPADQTGSSEQVSLLFLSQ
jgi:hypothetical protein